MRENRAVMLMLAAFASGACRTATRPSPASTPATVEAAEGTMSDDAAPDVLPERVKERLITRVERASAPEGGHRDLVAALHVLADAVELLRAADLSQVTDARRAVQELEVEGHDPETTGGSARRALEALQAALTAADPVSLTREFESTLVSLVAATATIDTDRSAHLQKDVLSYTLELATDAVLMASGASPHFRPAQHAGGEEPVSFELAVVQARDAVGRLATATFRDERLRAAEALRALATLVESAPEDARRSAHIITTARYEAARLGAPSGPHFRNGAWIIRGLSAVIDALVALSGPDDSALTPWIAEARRTVGSIDARAGLAFQRPAVQDAYRAILDAVVAVGQRRGWDESPADRSPR